MLVCIISIMPLRISIVNICLMLLLRCCWLVGNLLGIHFSSLGNIVATHLHQVDTIIYSSINLLLGHGISLSENISQHTTHLLVGCIVNLILDVFPVIAHKVLCINISHVHLVAESVILSTIVDTFYWSGASTHRIHRTDRDSHTTDDVELLLSIKKVAHLTFTIQQGMKRNTNLLLHNFLSETIDTELLHPLLGIGVPSALADILEELSRSIHTMFLHKVDSTLLDTIVVTEKFFCIVLYHSRGHTLIESSTNRLTTLMQKISILIESTKLIITLLILIQITKMSLHDVSTSLQRLLSSSHRIRADNIASHDTGILQDSSTHLAHATFSSKFQGSTTDALGNTTITTSQEKVSHKWETLPCNLRPAIDVTHLLIFESRSSIRTQFTLQEHLIRTRERNIVIHLCLDTFHLPHDSEVSQTEIPCFCSKCSIVKSLQGILTQATCRILFHRFKRTNLLSNQRKRGCQLISIVTLLSSSSVTCTDTSTIREQRISVLAIILSDKSFNLLLSGIGISQFLVKLLLSTFLSKVGSILSDVLLQVIATILVTNIKDGWNLASIYSYLIGIVLLVKNSLHLLSFRKRINILIVRGNVCASLASLRIVSKIILHHIVCITTIRSLMCTQVHTTEILLLFLLALFQSIVSASIVHCLLSTSRDCCCPSRETSTVISTHRNTTALRSR